MKPSADLLTSSERQRFARDGVLHLEQAFDEQWLALLAQGMERNMANPSPRYEERIAAGGKARYCEDFWVWSEFPEFHRFVTQSPAAAIAAALMQASRINLVMDNWFLREAGASARAPWHHDIAYFDFAGTMCVLWLPLEATPQHEGISFVRGSHRWGRLFQRVFFRDHKTAGTPGTVNGLHYEAPPDIDAAPDSYDLVSFDCEPGDCIVFDMRTLHGARSETTPRQTLRRFTLRMAAQDGRIQYRGDWAKGERAIFEAHGYTDGDPIAGDFFPQLWPLNSNVAN